MTLTTSYLGLALPSPLVASASPLGRSVNGIRELAAAGVGAVVLPSLFEEQLRREEERDAFLVQAHEDAFSEALSYFPSASAGLPGRPQRYLDLVERAARAVDIPVIASLNGSTPGGWEDFARSLQDAGAAAIELNVYFVPGDPHTSGREVEDLHVEILHRVKSVVTVPVAVKLSPHFSSPGEMALRLDQAGADGLVLFNRFQQPEIDIETLQVHPSVALSTPDEARLPRTWIAILRGHVVGSLAATTGVDQSEDVVKYLLSGADVVMTASALLRHGVRHARTMLDGLEDWMARRGLDSLEEVRGRLAVPAGVDAAAYERAGYVSALERARSTYGDLRVGARASAE
jgi:dihydroorotate dehydrogenase (fumarate)